MAQRAEKFFGYREEFEQNKGVRVAFLSRVSEGPKNVSDTEQNSSRVRVPEQNFEQNKRFLRAEFIQA